MEILARAAAAAALVWGEPGHGLVFTVTDGVHGAPLPPLEQTWLEMAPFEKSSLPTNPTARNSILRQRMKLLEVIVRLSMTRRYDWQTRFTSAASDGFSWAGAFEKLQDTNMAQTTYRMMFPQAEHTMRWGHPRLLISLVDEPVTEQYPEMLEQLLSAVAEDNSHEWRQDAAFRDLLDEDEQLSTSRATRHRVIEICISIFRGHITTSLLHGIFDVLERFEDAQQQRHDAAVENGALVSISFRVTALRFSIVCDMVSNAITELGERSRDLRFLKNVRITVPWKVEAISFQKCLSKISRSQANASETCDVAPFRLTVESDVSSFASLGATVRYPGVVSELDAAYVAKDMAAFAAWLAFGLFHVDSESQVSALCLRMPGTPARVEHHPPYALCSPAWIEIFKRVLTSVVASEDLAPLSVSVMSKNGKRKVAGADTPLNDSALDEMDLPHGSREFVAVSANTKAYAQPSPRSELVAVLGTPGEYNLSKLKLYQVIRKLRAWFALAIPGAGVGWIRARDSRRGRNSNAVVRRKTVPSKLPTPGNDVAPQPLVNPRIKSLTWIGGAYPADDDLRGPHADAVMELLAIIGQPLEELHLPWMALRNHHVPQIVRYCPNLRDLNIANNEITDISALVAAFEAGASKITSLNVGQYGEVNEGILRQTAQIVELGSSTLQRLVVRVTRVDATSGVHLRNALLHGGSQLEYVRVHCDDIDERDDYEQLEGDDQPTSARVNALFADVLATRSRCSRPLSVRSKAAMLSVCKHETLSASALSRLDQGVLSTIFELARTSHTRVVEIWDR